MIKFAVYRSKGEKITRLVIKGHAGYAEEGYDIVCAAVSTALWMAIKGIEALELAEVSYVQEDGFVDCRISEERQSGAEALLTSLLITVTELAKQFRKNVFIVNGEDLRD